MGELRDIYGRSLDPTEHAETMKELDASISRHPAAMAKIIRDKIHADEQLTARFDSESKSSHTRIVSSIRRFVTDRALRGSDHQKEILATDAGLDESTAMLTGFTGWLIDEGIISIENLERISRDEEEQ